MALPEETSNCAAYNPSPLIWENSFDWAQYENFPVWFNIPNSFARLGNSSLCRWTTQYGQRLVGTLSFFLNQLVAGGPFRFYLASNIAGSATYFRYEIPEAEWIAFGPNTLALTIDNGFIPGLPATVTFYPGV